MREENALEAGGWRSEEETALVKSLPQTSSLNPQAIPNDIPNFHLRHRVRPGLTGPAQIYAPRDATRRQKLRYDLLYLRTQSFWLDLKLIALSFWITFRGRWESREEKV
jgi:lipopolysaccharide/colanic/teichoic acid biosynthesis glycosyltransferase